MKRISLFILSLIFVSLPFVVQARMFNLPADQPLFSIDFPDDWTIRLNADGLDISAISPDEEIEYYIWKLPIEDISSRAVERVVEDELESVLAEINAYVKNVTFGKAVKETKNGIELVTMEGTGTSRDGSGTVFVVIDLFTPDGESLYCLLYYGSKSGERKHADAIKAIDDSIRKK